MLGWIERERSLLLGGRIRFLTVVCTLATALFQTFAEAHAAPATTAAAPWLDGRPVLISVAQAPTWRPGADGPLHFVRYDEGLGPRGGFLEGAVVLDVSGDVFGTPTPTGKMLRLSDVRLLSPVASHRLGGVTLLDLDTSADPAARAISLGEGSPIGPGDDFLVRSTQCLVRSVLGAVVGGSSQLLGVTGGTLLHDPTPGAWQLALGPSLVLGSRLQTDHDVGASGVRALTATLSDGAYDPGDVLLLDLTGPQPLTPRDGAWNSHIPGVGDLRNGMTWSHPVVTGSG